VVISVHSRPCWPQPCRCSRAPAGAESFSDVQRSEFQKRQVQAETEKRREGVRQYRQAQFYSPRQDAPFVGIQIRAVG
jgi:hypothetical protein